MITLPEAIEKLINAESLSLEQMQKVMQLIMKGKANDAQISGFLVALRIKGETALEISGAAQTMLSFADKVTLASPSAIDIVGTGGDGAKTFNISTVAAFVAAGAGVTVAKHGNRSVSSSSGSADLLEAMGAKLELNAQQVATVIDQTGLGFMFASQHHQAMKYAINARKSLATRTIFNVLGPLTNPAQVSRQVIGVYDARLCEALARVCVHLRKKHVLVVHSEDGLDEISIAAPTYVAEMQHGEIREYKITPEELGIKRASLQNVLVDNPEQSREIAQRVLADEDGAARDMVVLNAAAGIYVSGIAESLPVAVKLAQSSLSSGKAKKIQQKFVLATQSV